MRISSRLNQESPNEKWDSVKTKTQNHETLSGDGWETNSNNSIINQVNKKMSSTWTYSCSCFVTSSSVWIFACVHQSANCFFISDADIIKMKYRTYPGCSVCVGEVQLLHNERNLSFIKATYNYKPTAHLCKSMWTDEDQVRGSEDKQSEYLSQKKKRKNNCLHVHEV